MKNIKKSIFLTMTVVTCVSGMNEFSLAGQTMKAISGINNMILSMDKHQKEQLRAMQVHQQSQGIIMQNHLLGKQIASDNHELNIEQAKDRLQMAQDNHQLHKQQAEHSQKVDNNNRWFALEQALIDRRHQESASVLSQYQMKAQIALAQAETERAIAEAKRAEQEPQVENAFRQCLIDHQDSSDITVSGIPKVCAGHALALQFLGCDSKVDAMIAGFQKIMRAK